MKTAGMISLCGFFIFALFCAKEEPGESSVFAGEKAMKEKATFAAGCFWGVEYAFSKIKGVISARSGYTGGHLKDPSYEDVCSGLTGHAEAVEVEFDPAAVTYDQLLDAFWNMHNPTTLNRQGPDVGSQYRSAIFYHTEDQRKKAAASKEKLDASKKNKNPAVTRIVKAGAFYAAEEYHQKYHEKHPGRRYCPAGM